MFPCVVIARREKIIYIALGLKKDPHRSFVSSVHRAFKDSKMKNVYVLLSLVLFLECGIVLANTDYSNINDNVDVNAILRSDRLLKQYIACMLDKGPCSPDGRSFRKMLPEVLATNCSKCNDKQKKNVRRVSKHLKNEQPEEWTMIMKKYDANGRHRVSFERFLDEE